MFRYLVAVSCMVSFGACGHEQAEQAEQARRKDKSEERTAQVKIISGSESEFLAQYGQAWTKQAPGMYSLSDAKGKYQVAFGLEGTIAALKLAQQDHAEVMKSMIEQDGQGRPGTPRLNSLAQPDQVVSFWQQVVDSLAVGSPASDLADITHSAVGCGGVCTVVATATINPYRSCYAAASAEYSGIFSPSPAGAVSASAGTDSHAAFGSSVNVDAFDQWPCSGAFAAASIGGVSVTALPW